VDGGDVDHIQPRRGGWLSMIAPLSPEPSSDLGAIWRLLIDGKWLVLSLVLLFTLSAAAAAFLTTPVYRARVVMIPAQSTESAGGLGAMVGDLGGLAALAGLNIGGNEATVEALALLRSRQFADDFIAQERLLQRFFARKWDSEHNQWRVSGVDVPTDWDAWKYFDRKVRFVGEDKKTGLVTLDVNWQDRHEAADWANQLVDRLNEAMRTRAIAESEASIQLLQKELAATEVVALQQAIARLIETQVKRRTMATVRPEFVFRVVDPASAPDADDFIRPKRVLYLVAGPVCGFLVAFFLILLREFVRREFAMSGSNRARSE